MRYRAGRISAIIAGLFALLALAGCTESDDGGGSTASAAPTTPARDGYSWASWMKGSFQPELQVRGQYVGSVTQNKVRLDVYGAKEGQMLRDSPFVDTETYRPLFTRGDPSYITTMVVTNEGDEVLTLPFNPVKVEAEYYGSPYRRLEPATEQGDMTSLGYVTGPVALGNTGGYPLAGGQSAMVSTQWPFRADDILQLHVWVYKAGDTAYEIVRDAPLINEYIVDIHTPKAD